MDTFSLFQQMISGTKLEEDEIDHLLADSTPEDLYLEYKHGRDIEMGQSSTRMIRKYVSGFANSAGGLLLIGIDEANWKVTGCKAPGGGEVEKWAATCLTEISHNFSPPPRFFSIDHKDGKILGIAVDRSISLVPTVEGNEILYYFRFHDQLLEQKTIKAPQYLISDLLLGRKQNPSLRIKHVYLSNLSTNLNKDDEYDVEFTPVFKIENQGFSWAVDVRVGIVAWSRRGAHVIDTLNATLAAYIDIYDVPKESYPSYRNLSHLIVSCPEIQPFSVAEIDELAWFTAPLRIHANWYLHRWKAAIYIISRDSPPIWYQLVIDISNEFLKIANEGGSVNLHGYLLDINQLSSSQRAIVAWEGLDKT
jgi:hypothetical protein